MPHEDYMKALKAGRKDYHLHLSRGEYPYLQVLDEITSFVDIVSEVNLGLVQIPTELIAGTKSVGRRTAFAPNFMPLLEPKTEFSAKWTALYDSHISEGIHTPVIAYEFMNRFYIMEGNKRVSVLKYVSSPTVPAIVTRMVPRRTGETENKIYYEYMDFYELSKVNFIWFTKLGSFQKLQEAVGKGPKEVWSHDDQLDFSSIYTRFKAEYQAAGDPIPSITPGDAFLAFITLYGYDEVREKTVNELRELISKSWEEFKMLEEDEEVELKMDPNTEKKPLLSRLLQPSSPRLKVAFIYEKTVTSSAWTYAHELGRLHLEQTFPEEVSTCYYDGVTQENIDATLEDAVAKGCDLIFTTTPVMVQASVKAAIANPKVRILNCSVNTMHRYIRTYYSRMHEVKFLMGAIAGAMAENNRLSYIADYPIYGTIANINAFALGAQMTNPHAEVYLEWSSVKDIDVMENVKRTNSSCISGKDMVIPEEGSRFFGIYHLEDGSPHNLAMPVWHWGKFYEQLIRTIMNGTWSYDDDPTTKKAINYWWGMSAGVVDVICSQNLPLGMKRLVKVLKKAICSGNFNPFDGVLCSQNGIIQPDPQGVLSPEEIVTMDWLADNVIGEIPPEDKLEEQSRAVVQQQGVEKKKG